MREFTQSDISDAIELRGVLEGTAARFAAERGASCEAIAELRAICDTIEQMVHRADYESFERFVDLNERFHAGILRMAGSPMLERALDGIIALPFASPSAFVMAQAVLPQSRDILLLAHRHHLGLLDAIERSQGTRAESLGREHALLARTNLEVALDHPDVLEQMPGASLLARPELEQARDGRLGRATRRPARAGLTPAARDGRHATRASIPLVALIA